MSIHFQSLELEIQGPKATLWLNRPDVRNALDEVLLSEITQAINHLEQDNSVRVIILAGRGKVFCAGADLNWMKRMAAYSAEENKHDAMGLATMLKTLKEVRKPTITRVQGAAFADGMGLAATRQKSHQEQRGLIEWSPELKQTIDEALSLRRNNVAGSWFIFGNMNGQIYTKGGWKKTLSVLMNECVEEAALRKMPFTPFSLQDCRPKGVSDKLTDGATDVVDATLHTSERMVRQVYDRRRVKTAKPVR